VRVPSAPRRTGSRLARDSRTPERVPPGPLARALPDDPEIAVFARGAPPASASRWVRPDPRVVSWPAPSRGRSSRPPSTANRRLEVIRPPRCQLREPSNRLWFPLPGGAGAAARSRSRVSEVAPFHCPDRDPKVPVRSSMAPGSWPLPEPRTDPGDPKAHRSASSVPSAVRSRDLAAVAWVSPVRITVWLRHQSSRRRAGRRAPSRGASAARKPPPLLSAAPTWAGGPDHAVRRPEGLRVRAFRARRAVGPRGPQTPRPVDVTHSPPSGDPGIASRQGRRCRCSAVRRASTWFPRAETLGRLVSPFRHSLVSGSTPLRCSAGCWMARPRERFALRPATVGRPSKASPSVRFRRGGPRCSRAPFRARQPRAVPKAPHVVVVLLWPLRMRDPLASVARRPEGRPLPWLASYVPPRSRLAPSGAEALSGVWLDRRGPSGSQRAVPPRIHRILGSSGSLLPVLASLVSLHAIGSPRSPAPVPRPGSESESVTVPAGSCTLRARGKPRMAARAVTHVKVSANGSEVHPRAAMLRSGEPDLHVAVCHFEVTQIPDRASSIAGPSRAGAVSGSPTAARPRGGLRETVDYKAFIRRRVRNIPDCCQSRDALSFHGLVPCFRSSGAAPSRVGIRPVL